MHRLQEVIQGAGFETRDYSGRGMYGKYCLGVDLDTTSGFISTVGRYVRGEDDEDEIMRKLDSYSSDSMGLGIIVYWPSVPYEGSEDDEDDEYD
jgi:hypothetical protein